MFMSVVARQSGVGFFPEIAGARVVVTGLSSSCGVDVARGFADLKARLTVQTSDVSPAMTEVGALLAEPAAELNLFETELKDSAAATRLAQTMVQKLGGIDVLVNLIPVSNEDCAKARDLADIEALAVEKLGIPTTLTQVVANRMRLTWAEGTILNVVVMAAPQSRHEAAVAGYLRTALAAMTAGEARRWAGDAIRINAIGPRATEPDATGGACLANEPDIAALVLYLASKKGRKLTGLVFDAESALS